MQEAAPWWMPGWLRDLGLLGAARALRAVGGEHVAEIRSIAAIAEVDADELLAANLSYELLGLLGRFACSSASYEDARGRPVLVRTLDWSTPEAVGEHSIQVRLHRGRDSYDLITVPGFVGLLSAQRPGAWAMTLNMAPPAASLRQLIQRPVCLHLRAAADHSLTWRSLRRAVTAWQTAAPFFVHAVGVRSGERCVITGHGEDYEIREPDGDAPLVITNHHPDMAADGQGLPEAFPEDSQARYAALQRRLARHPHLPPAQGFRLLEREPVTCSITQHAMVLCPAARHLAWRLRPCPSWSVGHAHCPWADCGERDILIREGPGAYACPACGRELRIC